MWVYDYATGTIGIYYFSPINQSNSAAAAMSENSTGESKAPNNNFANPNNSAAPAVNPRLLAPIAPFTITPTVPLIPTPVYIRPYQPIQIYPTPIYPPQPIIIFR
jgi:hypothetical protein